MYLAWSDYLRSSTNEKREEIQLIEPLKSTRSASKAEQSSEQLATASLRILPV